MAFFTVLITFGSMALANAKTIELVQASSKNIIQPGQRIAGSDYEHFVQNYMIQRIGKQTYWKYI